MNNPQYEPADLEKILEVSRNNKQISADKLAADRLRVALVSKYLNYGLAALGCLAVICVSFVVYNLVK